MKHLKIAVMFKSITWSNYATAVAILVALIKVMVKAGYKILLRDDKLKLE